MPAENSLDALVELKVQRVNTVVFNESLHSYSENIFFLTIFVKDTFFNDILNCMMINHPKLTVELICKSLIIMLNAHNVTLVKTVVSIT